MPSTSTTTAQEASEEEAEARAVDTVHRFVELAGSGTEAGVGDAAELWSGYPYRQSEKLERVGGFADTTTWLNSQDISFEVVTSWSWDPSTAMRIVVAFDVSSQGAAAFLVDDDGVIQRIPGPDDLRSPVASTGGAVVIPGHPVEGGALAYVGTEPLDDEHIELHPEDGTVTVNLPTDVAYPLVLTVTMSTPEWPTALALVVTR